MPVCGGKIFRTQGTGFRCFDPSDNITKTCIALVNGNYRCFDRTNGKWEWPNWNERDFTPDNSHLTSIKTDGRLITSPSIDVKGEPSRTPSVLDDAVTSIYSRDDFYPDELRAASYYDEGNLILSDRSIERVKAAYYRPAEGYESPRTSVYSRN